MSLIQQVVAIVRERGEACADEIHIEGKTHKQIVKAMQNAADQRLIRTVRTQGRPGQRMGRRPNVYAPFATKPREREHPDRPLPPRGEYGHIGKVSSVFAMAAGLGA